jgi:hypothetical protein
MTAAVDRNVTVTDRVFRQGRYHRRSRASARRVEKPLTLLCNHSAGHAFRHCLLDRSSCRLLWRVEDQRGPAASKNRIASGSERDTRVDDGLGQAARCDREIVHVAGVGSLRVLLSVLLAIRIEVRAGRFERRRIAFRHLVDVDRMLAGWQILEIEGNRHSARGYGRKRRCSDRLAVRIFESDSGG